MQHPGKVFKEFRTGKGWSVKEAAGNSVTPQFLRKFESGNSDIRFSTLLELLNRINVTVTEFSCQMEDSLDHWLFQVENELDQAYLSGNSFALQTFITANDDRYQTTGELRYRLVAIMGMFMYDQSMSVRYNADLQPVRTYLRETETWGRFELFLIAYLATAMQIEESLLYARQILKGINSDYETNMWRYDAYIHIIAQMVTQKRMDLAETLWQDYQAHFSPDRSLRYIHQDLYGSFIHGLIKVYQGDPQGEKQCLRIIDTFALDSGYQTYANRLNIMLYRYKAALAAAGD